MLPVPFVGESISRHGEPVSGATIPAEIERLRFELGCS